MSEPKRVELTWEMLQELEKGIIDMINPFLDHPILQDGMSVPSKRFMTCHVCDPPITGPMREAVYSKGKSPYRMNLCEVHKDYVQERWLELSTSKQIPITLDQLTSIRRITELDKYASYVANLSSMFYHVIERNILSGDYGRGANEQGE